VLERQVLAPIVPADVHQLHGVERAFAAPWGTGRVRRLAFELVFDRDEARSAAIAPRHAKVDRHP
jgi:hypothetical protein